jgi:hypothetical protein
MPFLPDALGYGRDAPEISRHLDDGVGIGSDMSKVWIPRRWRCFDAA